MLRTLTKVLSTMGRNHRAEDVAKHHMMDEVGDLAEAPLEPEGVPQLGGRTRRSMAALVCAAAARVGRVSAIGIVAW